MCFSEKNFNALMATAVMLILVIPVGIANVWLGYVVGESPCVLCWWERIGMILVGLLGLFILRYGPRLRYVAAVFFIAAFGMHMGLRHLGNFVQLDVDMGLGASILGVRTYTWAAIVYWAVVIVMSLFLIFIKKSAELNADFSGQRSVIKPFSAYGKVVFYLSFALVISNGVQAFFTNGIPPYGGKAPTDRMSLNLAMSSKTWERYVWDRLKSFNLKKDYPQRPYIRGVFDTKKFNENFADGAVLGASKLELLGTKQIEIKMNRGEMIASVSYDEKNQEFALTSSYAGSYFTKDLKNFDKFAVLDYQNSWNLGHTTASAFVGEDLLVIGQNKTAYGLKKLKEPMDKVIEYRTFLQTSGDYGSYFEKSVDRYTKDGRPFLTMIRAKQAYALAFGADEKFMYIISAPNDVVKNVVIGKFLISERKLSAEAYLKPAKGLALKQKRNFKDYYVVGAASAGDQILAYSREYNTLLSIDKNSLEVVQAYEMPQMSEPHSLAVGADRLYVLGFEGDKNLLYEIERPF